MPELFDTEGQFSRRKFLAMGGAVAVAGAVGPWVDPLSALASTRWPDGRLGARDAIRVKQSQFMPLNQFRAWTAALDDLGPVDQKGLRATGTPAHEGYIDELHNLLDRAGVKGLHFDRVPMIRWTTGRWALQLLDGPGAGPVKTASYVPYSGRTSAQGVVGPLVNVDVANPPARGSLAGKIAVVDVTIQVVPESFFTGLGYPGATYDPHHEFSPTKPYKRPYLSNVVKVLDTVKAADAAAVVCVLDYPSSAASGSYFPYDGTVRSVPGLFVDRYAGVKLKQQAEAGVRARLTLPASVTRTASRNLIAFVPGRSSELVALHCHTDGTNAIEDNGPATIVAISQYLTRLPEHALPRTIMILLTTGHFHGGNGSRAFCAQHATDLVRRTNAATTIEHLGTREWNEISPGRMGLTGRYEAAGIFAPGSKALVDAGYAMLTDADNHPGGVLKPLNPTASGGPNDAAWPGEGQYLFARSKLADANYITGPTYLLNWGITTFDKLDFHRMRAQAIAFTEMILRLGRTPRSKLMTYTL
jgi:Peptidase family M28